ncbi:MAG: histidinol-phosphate transaminase [Opitutales bacterium]|nr:histidinol-phosphate transaminase [Opitutales bacterium]
MKFPEQWALPHIQAIHPYTPGTQPEGDGWIKLNTNELPYPPSPRVKDAIASELDRLPLYPNPASRPLRSAIAKRFGLDNSQVIIGNGSDDLLNLLMRAFSDGQADALQTFPSYSLYPVLAAIANAKLQSVKFDKGMDLPVDELAQHPARICFLTSPNAPTGVGFSNASIRQLLSRFDGLVVVDEAYADFAEENAVELLKDHPNIVITRTFSKSYGLAGLRVGFALASSETISILDRIRDSYNVNRLSQAGALAAFEDPDYYAEVIRKVIETRERIREALIAAGWEVYPSQSNFLFARPPQKDGISGPERSLSAFEYLNARKILVRHFPSNPLTADYIRISIGTDNQMNRLMESLQSWQSNA